MDGDRFKVDGFSFFLVSFSTFTNLEVSMKIDLGPVFLCLKQYPVVRNSNALHFSCMHFLLPMFFSILGALSKLTRFQLLIYSE